MLDYSDFERPWLKYYNHEQTSDNLEYPDISIYEIVRRAAERLPERHAYEFQDRTTSYRDFIGKVDHLASCLYKLGIRKDDKVIICMPNTPQAVDMFYAISKCGAVATMVHPLSAKNEIEYYINLTEAKFALTLDAFVKNFTDIKENTCLEKLIVTSIKDELSFVKKIGFSLTLGRKIPKYAMLPYMIRWKDLLALSPNDDMPEVENTGKDPAVILFSGGTTGKSKGIVLSNLSFNATVYETLACSNCIPCHIQDLYTDKAKELVPLKPYKVLSVMPMFHGFGLCVGVHTFLTFGGTCILIPSFTPDSFAKLIVTKRPNFIAGVPSLYEHMVRSDIMKDADLSCLEGIFAGGDSLSDDTRIKVDAFLKEHNCKTIIREGYGLTESVTATCLTPVNEYRLGSIGIPFPDVLFKIVRIGTSETLPYGEEGEICIFGPNLMTCYYNNPEETEDTLRVHPDGRRWLHTGDIGTMDEDGFVYFKQRYKRMIVRSGYNIYPSSIENVIDSVPEVKMSCVIGVFDPIKQKKVKAFIVLEDGIEPSDELLARIKGLVFDNIAKYALPKEYEFIDKMPMTKVGKIAYRELEEMEEKKRLEAEKA